MAGLTWIYALVDPRTSLPRYVGKTVQPIQRLRAHISGARGGRAAPRVSAWIAGLKLVGRLPRMMLLQQVPGESWQTAEFFWICFLRWAGADLANHTVGGAGPNGRKQLQPEREKRRRLMIRRYLDPAERKKTADATARALQSPEIRTRLSANGMKAYASSLGRLTPEQRSENAKKANAARNRVKNADGKSMNAVRGGRSTMSKPGHARQMGRLGAMALANSEDGRRAIAKASASRWQESAYRERVANSQREYWAAYGGDRLRAKAMKAWNTRRARYGHSGRRST